MVFRDWQAQYAAHGVATFPVRVGDDGKTPAIRGWQRVGLPGSAKLGQQFADADAFGFCPGRGTGLTILDVDSNDECALADALDRHGPTPIIVRSGSGNYQAWYRWHGERRRIRPTLTRPSTSLAAVLWSRRPHMAPTRRISLLRAAFMISTAYRICATCHRISPVPLIWPHHWQTSAPAKARVIKLSGSIV